MLNIRHTCFCVNSLEKADFFYRHLLGLHYVDSKREIGDYIKSLLGLDSLTWVKLRTDNGELLELYWLPKDHNKTFNHVAFTVDNLIRLRNKLIEYEIHCSDIQIDESRKHKVMFCIDPDSNLIELVEEINESQQEEEPYNWNHNSEKRETGQKNNKQNNKTQNKSGV